MSMMNYVVIFILFVVGYVCYPPLFGKSGKFKELVYITAEQKALQDAKVVKTVPKNEIVTQPDPTPVPVPQNVTPVVDASGNTAFSLSKVIPTDFPKSCEMVSSGVASISDGNGSITLDVGEKLLPLAIVGNNLKVKLKKLNIEGVVPIQKTNFLELVTPMTMARLNPKPTPTAEVKPANKPKEQEEPKVTPMNELSDSEVKALLNKNFDKLSTLKGSKVRTAGLSGNESFGGKMYQIGVVRFEKDTLFGMRQLSAKALIADGQIEKWVWFESGQEIR